MMSQQTGRHMQKWVVRGLRQVERGVLMYVCKRGAEECLSYRR